MPTNVAFHRHLPALAAMQPSQQMPLKDMPPHPFTEGADGIAVSSAPFQALAAHSQLSSSSLATLIESYGSLLLGKRIYWEIINIQNKARHAAARR